jgi:hypothetical protein
MHTMMQTGVNQTASGPVAGGPCSEFEHRKSWEYRYFVGILVNTPFLLRDCGIFGKGITFA